MQINGRGVLAENSDGSASLLNNVSRVIANSGQGSDGNDYNVVWFDGGGGSGYSAFLAADNKSMVFDIHGVSNAATFTDWIDNSGVSAVNVANQEGSYPSTYGVYIPHPSGAEYPLPTASPTYSVVSLNGFDFQCYYPGNAGNLCNITFIDSGSPGDYHVESISADFNAIVLAVPVGESNLPNMVNFAQGGGLSNSNVVFANDPSIAVTQTAIAKTYFSGGTSTNLSGGGDNNQTTINWKGGKGKIYLSATTYNGDTLAVEMTSPHGTAITVKDSLGSLVSVTADGSFDVDLPPGELNVTYSSAFGVYAYIIGEYQDSGN